MAFTPDYRSYARAPGADSAVLDQGLRAYMLRVYNWMASGLLVTGIVAYGIANSSLLSLFYRPVASPFGGVTYHQTGLAILAMLAPLAFVLVLSFGVNRLSKTSAQAIYWAFCAAMGASLTNIFLVYAHDSIARVFFVTAGTFAATSLYGYTTRSDLTRMGSFMMMGLFGLVIASVVNIFLASSMTQFVISVLGVVIFTGLTAYDTQRIKSDYINAVYASGPDGAAMRSVYDALALYLNFVNLFTMLLQLMGDRNRN